MTTSDTTALKAYLRDIGRYPLLSTKETNALFAQYNSASTSEAEKQRIKAHLVNSNLRLVVSIAKEYKDHGVPMLDLIQEGNIGLMTGVERFDHTRGFRLSTYASHWIKQAIRRHLTDTSRTVRLPSHVVALLPKIRKCRNEYNEKHGEYPSPKQIARELGCTTETVQAALDASGPVYAVDLVPGGDDKRASPNQVERQMNESTSWDIDRRELDDIVVHDQLRNVVRKAFVDLTPREEQVLRLRFGCMEDPDDVEQFPISEEELAELQKRAQ